MSSYLLPFPQTFRGMIRDHGFPSTDPGVLDVYSYHFVHRYEDSRVYTGMGRNLIGSMDFGWMALKGRVRRGRMQVWVTRHWRPRLVLGIVFKAPQRRLLRPL